MHRIARMAAGTALLVACASACSGGAKPSATPRSTVPASTTSTVGTTTTTIDPDQAKATAALLTVSDLPAGWTASSDDNSSDDSGFGGQDGTDQIAACLGVSSAELDSNPPSADSPTFTSADGANTVDDEVDVYSTVAAANEDYSLFSSSKTPRCMSQAFNGPLKAQFTQQLQPGQTLVSFSAAAESFPRLADHSGELQMTFVVRQAGLDIKVFVDLILIVKGRSETTLTVSQPQVLSLPQLGLQMARIAAARMTA